MSTYNFGMCQWALEMGVSENVTEVSEIFSKSFHGHRKDP
jgi:hypothetical protein